MVWILLSFGPICKSLGSGSFCPPRFGRLECKQKMENAFINDRKLKVKSNEPPQFKEFPYCHAQGHLLTSLFNCQVYKPQPNQ